MKNARWIESVVKVAQVNRDIMPKESSSEGVYYLRPRRASRLAAKVREELELVEQGTLDETMSRLRGRRLL